MQAPSLNDYIRGCKEAIIEADDSIWFLLPDNTWAPQCANALPCSDADRFAVLKASHIRHLHIT
jgi:hypothetical protein